MMTNGIKLGAPVRGFAWGIFGRDSYCDRRVEVVAYDYVVTRNERGEVELVTGEANLELLTQYIESDENKELGEE